jgi:UDP-N-acetylmuramoyl-L-alanyl-D-glutamate--2,6-diaminopimelate ligase
VALSLGNLCAGLRGLELQGDSGTIIDSITADSRKAGPGVLFVAVRGTGGDGHRFVDQALAAGSPSVAVAHDALNIPSPDATGNPAVLVADDTRPLPALLSQRLEGYPDRKLWTAAVTGTNGKTTVSYLLQGMLSVLQGPCGLLGTIRYDDGTTSIPAPLTTPGGPEFYHWLGLMKAGGCRSVAMELSSHGLDQGRVAGLGLDVAVMTNLGRDHLDYHGDKAAYLKAKAHIMDLLRPGDEGVGAERPGVLVLNAADPVLNSLATGDVPVVRFRAEPGLANGAVDLQVTRASLTMSGTVLELDWRGRPVTLRSPLVGTFNAANLTAALAAGLALDIDPAACAEALAGLDQVPGRLERIPLPSGGLAVVDYAHTHDALEAVLNTCDKLAEGRLMVVFGCGGDRDKGKRPLMGEVAARSADRTWITSDNPRTEDPAAICAEVKVGYDTAGQARSQACEVIEDRTTAITMALAETHQGDIVVVAGKGHEDYQLVGDKVLDLDDRRIVRDWVAGRVAGEDRRD